MSSTLRRGAPILAIAATLALSGCQFSGGGRVIGPDGSCTDITVPTINVTAPTAATQLPGPIVAPCSSTPAPPTTTVAAPTTTVAPPTTTVPPSSTTVTPPTTTAAPTSTSTPPPAGDQSQAATRLGWGTPSVKSDEFNYTGGPDLTRWDVLSGCSTGHDGNGQRCAARSAVAGGYLRETGLGNGQTGWLGSKVNQRYGRWEVRMRAAADSTSGNAYHPVLLAWPASDKWPSGGEYDFAETDIGDPGVDAFIHHPTQSGVVQDHYAKTLDMTVWHNYALDWTPGHVRGYIDGVLWFDDTSPGAQAPGPMHLTIQLDDLDGTHQQAAHMDVDWARIYAAS